VHAASLSAVLKELPATHAAHWRSAMAVPSVDLPCPMTHVRQAVHVPAVAPLNVPEAQGVHAAVSPGLAPPSVLKVPAAQVVHAIPSSAYLPSGQLLQSVTASCPVADVLLPSGHASHAVFSPAALYLPTAHTVHVAAPDAEY